MGRKSKIEEGELLQLLINRDKRCIEILYDNYSSVLYGVIHRIVKSNAIAEDVLQEVFLKIWNKYGQYDPSKSSLTTWLLGICRNLAIEKMRSKEFTENYKNLLNAKSIGKTDIVNELEPEYKQIIDLLYFDGYSQSEAAEKLNIPLGTVKTRSKAAIDRLGNYFE